MSQYKLGTVSVVNNNATVNFSGASSGAENVAIGDSFKVDRDGEAIYQVATRTPASGASLTSLTLTVVYGGTTGSGLGFQLTTDFTTNRSYPELAQGDADAADWLTAALRKIDQDMGNLFGQVGAMLADEVVFWNGTILDSDPTFKYNNTNKQLRLSTTGSAAGLLIGGDAQWYRSAADVMRTPDSLTVDGNLIVSGVGPNAFGGAPVAATQLTQYGTFAGNVAYDLATVLTLASGNTGAGLLLDPTLVEFSSGVHPNLSGLDVLLSITAGAATTTDAQAIRIRTFAAAAGTTNASGLKIDGPPTGATNVYALWIAGSGRNLIQGTDGGHLWFNDGATHIGEIGGGFNAGPKSNLWIGSNLRSTTLTPFQPDTTQPSLLLQFDNNIDRFQFRRIPAGGALSDLMILTGSGILALGTTVVTGAAPSDVVLKNGGVLMGVNNAGAAVINMIQLNSSDQVHIAAAGGDIKWGRALVALGGGAAPTFGTIGGSGPATAAQNTWMRVIDSAGAAFWVPAWK